MDLKQIIEDQKEELFELMKDKKLITREFQPEFKAFDSSKLVKVVTGIRRAGKSVFLYQFLKDRPFAYLNFDDDRLGDIQPDDILKVFYDMYGKNFNTIFFDEIQNLPRWELFINRLKRSGFNVFITGSNAKLLSTELATHLTGRHLAMEIYPFSFREYLAARDLDINDKTTKGKSLIKHELDSFIQEGAFPEVVVEQENYKLYLKALYRQILESDILTRRKISYRKAFKEVAASLVSNSGNLVTYNKIKKQFNFKSEHTVKNYISHLHEAYLIIPVSKFSFKPVEIEKSPKKIYTIDTGLINAISAKFSANTGRLYETVTAIELKRKQSLDDSIEIYYYKNPQNYEVDFVIKKDLKVEQLIQVSYNLEDADTKNREIRALLYASKDLDCSEFLIITGDYEGIEEVEWFNMKAKIRFLHLWKWLLEEALASFRLT
jgi:predicted AAA+ superfamily ATPase